RMRHDMANHLNAMAGMEDKNLRAYLSQLIASPAMTTGQRFCENEIVNAVLSGKQPALEHSGIQAEIQVALPAKLPISDMDLCAIFSHCMDNAIEACEQCVPGNRKLRLQARAEKGIFAFRLENSMTGKLQAQNGRLHTTKADKEMHGRGMAALHDIVQQKGGILKFGQAGNSFKLQMSIPFSE
ncbi:MAG: ATP-binding protein, partial [Clostridiales bacterium]|nr:ATP-binding protein [Clostridiales bacterium]